MKTPDKVTGSQCLEFVNRPIGFCSQTNYSASAFLRYFSGLADPRRHIMNTIIKEDTVQNEDVDNASYHNMPLICKFNHDVSKRIIGYVMDQYDDGGYKIAILGNEILDQNPAHGSKKNCEFYNHEFTVIAQQQYRTNLDLTMDADGVVPFYPEVVQGRMQSLKGTYSKVSLTDYDRDSEFARDGLSYEEMLDYKADFSLYDINGETQPNLSDNYKQLTNDPETTMIFGEGVHHVLHMNSDLMGDPLSCLQGDMFQLAVNKLSTIPFPRHFENSSAWQNFELDMGEIINSFNMVCVPYNIILTESLQFAQAYLSDGTLPPDAYLFPIDWSKLPTYEGTTPDPDDPSDNPPDEPDDNTPNDENDDIIDNPPVAPDNVPAMFTNYNWYWLSIGDYSAFIHWFWNDIGNFSDFDDIINKVKGLYNDLASAVIMVRYMPVNVNYIGGIGTQQPLKIGMIQRASGNVDTLAMNRPPIVEIGSIQIDRKYKSFLDFSPYSQLALYLPYHGYIDLDINVFSGHLLVVYGVYDVLSGTLQYMIYRQRNGKRMLVNTIVCKIAVDIPITLQTKNDRDSAIFQNVSSTVGGLIGAVGGMASGNPIGAMIGLNAGMNAFTSSNASAPLNVKGTVAETGAMYAPHKCSIILRHPTIQGSDSNNKKSTWLKYVGRATSYGYTLGSKDMIGSGLTVCTNPRVTFKNSSPLQSEIDEIYDYLSKGVIL